MKSHKWILGIVATLLFGTALYAKELGPYVSEYRGKELKWEEGAYGYHVMFKSLLANLDTANDTSGGMYNPQADACLEKSSYALDETRLPKDAIIERAFLVWTGAQPTAKLGSFTDFEVRLDFKHESNEYLNSDTYVVGRPAEIGDEQDFEFESVKEEELDATREYFTHRVDVTDFFKQTQLKGHEVRVSDGTTDGKSLYGTYTVSGLDCTTDAAYLDKTVIVSSWAIILIYVSEEVSPQKVYLYEGFYSYQHTSTGIWVTGFEFSDDPLIRLTLMVNEGDPGLINLAASTIPESIQIRGEDPDLEQLFNTCNNLMQADNAGSPFQYTEVFNSISSEYLFDPFSGETCIGGLPPNNIDKTAMEYAIDVDTFFIDASKDPWKSHFFRYGNTIELLIGANQDFILSNFLILAHETRPARFDIPGKPEKVFCSCAPEEHAACFDEPFWYAIMIQNWGKEDARQVTVQDILPSYLDYVPGTAQMASEFTEDASGNWIGKHWEPIPDGPDGAFPLEEPYLIADTMGHCDPDTEVCAGDHDRRMIRFMVQTKSNLPKHTVIDNIGLIADQTTANNPYRTNTAIPVVIHAGTCPTDTDCTNPDMTECGGVESPETTDDNMSDGSSSTEGEDVSSDSKDTVHSDADTDGSSHGCALGTL